VQIIFEKSFLRGIRRLPEKLKDEITAQLILLQLNPFTPTLHTKRLHGPLAGLYSFRIDHDYRVLFSLEYGISIHLIDIGHRKNIYLA